MNPRRYTIDPITGCWVWNDYIQSTGYGQMGFSDRLYLAHRISYAFHRGGIPNGKEIDHLCRNRACVNPDHLELVTRAENTRRGDRARLDWEIVALIRSAPLETSNRKLAAQLGVGRATVQNARSGRTWADEDS